MPTSAASVSAGAEPARLGRALPWIVLAAGLALTAALSAWTLHTAALERLPAAVAAVLQGAATDPGTPATDPPPPAPASSR